MKSSKKFIPTSECELLAPAGDLEKLKTAVHFGANAVYLAGKSFGLRAFAGNFDTEQMREAVEYAHEHGVKVYVTVNIYANNDDFDTLPQYLSELSAVGVDAVLVSDLGIVDLIKTVAPNLPIHLSTQANTTNKYAVRFWQKLGVARVVVARECSIEDIKQMREFCPDMELETFVHGAMCISYSGRCLLSNYLTDRASNRGACVQACRWSYTLTPDGHDGEQLPIQEDDRGTYILNSRDLNMLEYLDELVASGVSSLKIEGRMKSPYYVGTVVNAYRRALDRLYKGEYDVADLKDELVKTSHRSYSTGFFFDKSSADKQYYDSSRATATAEFVAVVKSYKDGVATVEMRNRFAVGDELEILSTGDGFNKKILVEYIRDLDGNRLSDCKVVQQLVQIPCKYELFEFDILRTC